MRPNTICFWRGRLPHWEVGGAVYFVTIHIAGAIPPAVAHELRRKVCYSGMTQWKTYEHIYRRIEDWLDRTSGISILSDPQIAGITREAIEQRIRTGIWRIHEYVIMPNHLHMLMDNMTASLSKSIVDFKHWTAFQAARTGKIDSKRLWQREWFDHWLRDSSEIEAIRDYIRRNPVKAGLVADYREWPYGSWK